jgi:DNA-binding PadR family transcriptional regulator
MNLTRLMALGTLARYGPQHGHQIRRLADLTNVGEWGGVSVGALYRELRTMEREGLVELVRTEQVGRRPARTVYQITEDGRLELVTLRDRAIRPTEIGPDPLGVALTFAVDDMDREELREALRNRRNRLAMGAAELTAERERLVAKGHIGQLTAANMRRGVLHMETEVGWLLELDAELAAECAEAAGGPGRYGGAGSPSIGGSGGALPPGATLPPEGNT